MLRSVSSQIPLSTVQLPEHTDVLAVRQICGPGVVYTLAVATPVPQAPLLPVTVYTVSAATGLTVMQAVLAPVLQV